MCNFRAKIQVHVTVDLNEDTYLSKKGIYTLFLFYFFE